MIKQLREDTDWLLKISPEELDSGELKDAIILLADCQEDMEFQASLPRETFQGSDYDKWRQGLLYKLNKVKSARRRFSAYNKKVAEETGYNLLKSLCRAYFSGNTNVEPTIRHMVMEDGE